ncbi:unnamed protein product [Lupinus luteus]|uniref:Uncharacterized protein n=1 Tax=Lupinus luteus TaxID=3873 RepID=A0AAV1XY20_LUPLU
MTSSSSSGSRVLQPGLKDHSLLHMQEQHISHNFWKGDLDRNLKYRRAQQFYNGASSIPTPIVPLSRKVDSIGLLNWKAS